MAKNPTFTLKTGADLDMYISREATTSGDDNGKILSRDGVYRFPYLTRQTGNSIKGSVEKIESNELRKGRVNSAPRLGAESSDGSLDFEFSPETFDDFLEAVFRGKWKPWTGDTHSESNKEKATYADGYFATQCGESGARKLIDDGTGSGDALGLIKCATGAIIHELNPGTEDIKYSVFKQFGGKTGENLYQDFAHVALNAMSLNVAINSIITGSFSVMGGNNPRMLKDDTIKTHLDARFADVSMTGEKFLENLPEKASGTMQFTAREGFLYVGGKNIEFANALSFNLDNGLEKKFAIFVQNAISTTPLKLDINGDLTTFLVHDGSDELINKSIDDETTEILFCFQDKEENPENLYVFQVFKTKLESSVDMNGEDTIDTSMPWTSFDEEACRVFRIMLPRVVSVDTMDNDLDGEPDQLVIFPNIQLEDGYNLDDLTITAKVDGVDKTADLAFTPATLVTDVDDDKFGCIISTFTPVAKTTADQILEVKISWKGKETNKSFVIRATGTYSRVVPQVGPAPLSDPMNGEYDVKGNYPAELELGGTYNLTLETVTPIKRHQNGNGVEGHWCGFYVKAPVGSKKFHYRKDYGDDWTVLDSAGWQHTNNEKNVDGHGNDGVAFYFDKDAAGNKKAYVALRFDDTPEGQEFKFCVDLSKVEIE